MVLDCRVLDSGVLEVEVSEEEVDEDDIPDLDTHWRISDMMRFERLRSDQNDWLEIFRSSPGALQVEWKPLLTCLTSEERQTGTVAKLNQDIWSHSFWWSKFFVRFEDEIQTTYLDRWHNRPGRSGICLKDKKRGWPAKRQKMGRCLNVSCLHIRKHFRNKNSKLFKVSVFEFLVFDARESNWNPKKGGTTLAHFAPMTSTTD